MAESIPTAIPGQIDLGLLRVPIDGLIVHVRLEMPPDLISAVVHPPEEGKKKKELPMNGTVHVRNMAAGVSNDHASSKGAVTMRMAV